MQSKDAILKTLLYADIFDYPLTQKEIVRFLISPRKIKQEELLMNLKNITRPIFKKNSYYFLEEKSDTVKIREKKDKESIEKLKIAKKIIKRISIIPSVKFIGISGALSMNNSDKDDDIDIFVISERHLVWTTRFLLIIALKALGVYRDKNALDYSNKICLNMILDEDRIRFDKKKWNLYLAHEIVQLIPVFDKDKTYEKFILANDWTKGFLPNAEAETNYSKNQGNFSDFLLNYILKMSKIEVVLRFMQKEYMKKNITKEVIKEGFLAFHPFDYESYILKQYKAKLKAYKL